ncbi:MAG: HAD-IA family hydrolase [Burkholderiaceae bacterium]|nr:HAD-IA family hydrolase [Burkholderiaceae bacterium]
MAYDLISFDLDGTLVDTAGEITEAANLALQAHGIERRPVAEITDLIGPGTREMMLDLLARCFREKSSLAHAVRPEAVLASFDRHYAVITGSSALAYPGCHEALLCLKQAGVRLACTTNKELDHARRVLAAARLAGYFDLVIGGDSLPEKKPHRCVLAHAMHTLKAGADRTAHVGDSSIDIEAARNAGVHAWAVPYGYNGGRPIESFNPDRVFQSLPDVARHVLAGPIVGLACTA